MTINEYSTCGVARFNNPMVCLTTFNFSIALIDTAISERTIAHNKRTANDNSIMKFKFICIQEMLIDLDWTFNKGVGG